VGNRDGACRRVLENGGEGVAALVWGEGVVGVAENAGGAAAQDRGGERRLVAGRAAQVHQATTGRQESRGRNRPEDGVDDDVDGTARGLDVLACFDADHRTMSLSEVAAAAGLARPTARRLLLTLEELGFVRSTDGSFQLTPKVLTLGMAYVGALGLWDIAKPHLEALVARTGESSSMAQLDGSDIVYVARVSMPKIIALRVDIGTRFPAAQTSQGKVLLAALSPTSWPRRSHCRVAPGSRRTSVGPRSSSATS
jgi:hypothetical protein